MRAVAARLLLGRVAGGRRVEGEEDDALGLRPSGTACRLPSVRTNSPAITSTSSDRAICTATSGRPRPMRCFFHPALTVAPDTQRLRHRRPREARWPARCRPAGRPPASARRRTPSTRQLNAEVHARRAPRPGAIDEDRPAANQRANTKPAAPLNPRHHQALGQVLPREAQPARAERQPHRRFPAAAPRRAPAAGSPRSSRRSARTRTTSAMRMPIGFERLGLLERESLRPRAQAEHRVLLRLGDQRLHRSPSNRVAIAACSAGRPVPGFGRPISWSHQNLSLVSGVSRAKSVLSSPSQHAGT